jgi:hypothetical protein
VHVTSEDLSETLSVWRQGDVILGEMLLPLLDVGEGGPEIALTESDGGVLLTQSCDVVRDYERKPYVQIASIRQVTDAELERARRGQEIRYLYVPSLANKNLVADLDITSTVDKRALIGKERLEGCSDDGERRQLAQSIARHRVRFAFPDEFNSALRPLRRWVERGAGKDSDKGRFIDAIYEIRVVAAAWDDPEELEFICIIPADTSADTREIWTKEHIPSLEKQAKNKWCENCTFRLATLREMSAEEYLNSDRLDFDGLSDA